MAVGKKRIREWLERGIQTGATHVIVVCDKWDYEDYPVYVEKTESVETRMKRYNHSNMQEIMEVYDLSMDIESQLNEFRAWHA